MVANCDAFYEPDVTCNKEQSKTYCPAFIFALPAQILHIQLYAPASTLLPSNHLAFSGLVSGLSEKQPALSGGRA
jgi:hypothetical protein